MIMTIELPSPCPICGKRHKRGSNPYNKCLKEYIKTLKWHEQPANDSIFDHAREDLRDAIEVFQGKEAADKWYSGPTKTEEFFTRTFKQHQLESCRAHAKYRDAHPCKRCENADFNDNDEDYCKVGNYGRDDCPEHVEKPHCTPGLHEAANLDKKSDKNPDTPSPNGPEGTNSTPTIPSGRRVTSTGAFSIQRVDEPAGSKPNGDGNEASTGKIAERVKNCPELNEAGGCDNYDGFPCDEIDDCIIKDPTVPDKDLEMPVYGDGKIIPITEAIKLVKQDAAISRQQEREFRERELQELENTGIDDGKWIDRGSFIDGEVTDVVIPIGVVPDIPVTDAIPEDLIELTNDVTGLVNAIGDGPDLPLIPVKDVVNDITKETVNDLVGKIIPVYDLRGTEHDDGEDHYYYDTDDIPRYPDELKIGSAQIHVDKDGNVSSTITLEDGKVLDYPVGRDLMSIAFHPMGTAVNEGDAPFEHKIKGMQDAVKDDIIKLYEKVDPSLKGKIADVKWDMSIPMDKIPMKPPSGAAHLTVKPGNDVKKGVYYEAIIDENDVVSRRKLTEEEIKEIEKYDDGVYKTAFEVLCNDGKRCPKCDVECESRVKPYTPSLLSRIKHKIGSFFHGSG
jgi:hypothetical protein